MPEPSTKSVACLPRAGDDNPYQRLMMAGLAEGGGFVVRYGAAGKVMPLLRTQLSARPDIIHLDWVHQYLYRRRAWMTAAQHALFFADVLLARVFGARLAWTLHNVRPHGREGVGAARRWFARQCFFIRVFSAESVDEVCELFEVPPARVHHVPEGSYVDVYPPTLPYEASVDERLMVYVGNLRPYKGVRELIDAFVATAAPEWRLRIYGRAFDEAYASACARAAATDERVTIEEGFVAVERLPHIYAAADLVCLPFLKVDNSGSALMAMGYERAVVAPAMGALRERLAGQPELLYATGELPAALQRAMSMSREELRSIGLDNARALERHTWRDYGQVLAKALRAVALSLLVAYGVLLTPRITSAQSPTPWRANWIAHPAVEGSDAATVLFRRTVTLGAVPDAFPVAVSADNAYHLYVNGEWVGTGPQLGTISNYRYDTLDLAPYLRPGRNVVAARVTNYGHYRMFGVQSVHTAFLLQGTDSLADATLTTRGYDGAWQTRRDSAWREHAVQWRVAEPDIIGGLYANHPTDSFAAARHPWGWATDALADGPGWVDARFLERGSRVSDGSGMFWMLAPRSTPRQRRLPGLPLAVRATRAGYDTDAPYRRGQGAPVDVPADWAADTAAVLRVPPDTELRVLLDAGEVTLGVPELRWRGGAGAMVKYTYVENLFAPDKSKPHRDSVDGAIVRGYFDVVEPDGGEAVRAYRPSHYRTFRYVEVAVRTADDALELYAPRYERVESTVAMPAAWASSDAVLDSVWALGRRTVRLTTQDYFLSDAYYETMQYVGDTKVHALVWQALTGDYRHTRSALYDFHRSRNAEGMLTSAAPLRTHFYHGSYSLIWVDMVADYLARTRDTATAIDLAAGIEQTLDYFARHSNPETGLLEGVPYKPFVDWYIGGRRGIDPSGVDSLSVPYAVQYAHALQSATEVMSVLAQAPLPPARQRRYGFLRDEYREEYARVRDAVRAVAYDPARHLLREQPGGAPLSQHATILGVLTGVVPEADRAAALASLSEAELIPATYYFRYYLLEALRQNRSRFVAPGADGPPDERYGELIRVALEPWYGLIADGATTAVERFEDPGKPTRSEAHPWGTAPTLFVYSLYAGIELDDAAADTIDVAPYFGHLTAMRGYCPAYGPDAGVRFDLRRGADGGLRGRVEAQSRPVRVRYGGRVWRVPAGERVVFE